jgi:hypothetical protein
MVGKKAFKCKGWDPQTYLFTRRSDSTDHCGKEIKPRVDHSDDEAHQLWGFQQSFQCRAIGFVGAPENPCLVRDDSDCRDIS